MLTLGWVGTALRAGWNWCRLPTLPERASWSGPPDTIETESVALIIPARNEETSLPATLSSVKQLFQPNLRLYLVNDHSTDSTKQLFDEAAAQDPRIVTLHDPPLAPGWMGKNNALWQAAQLARGADWFLFTDADVIMAPDTIGRALQYARATNADLLTLTPRLDAVGWGELLVLPPLVMQGMTVLSFDAARNPDKPKLAIGIGAFLLVRSQAYWSVGGHAKIAGQVLDDIHLAKLFKAHRKRVEVADGHALLHLRMYHSLSDVFRGFRKNMYAGVGERWPVAIVAMIMMPLSYCMAGAIFGIAVWRGDGVLAAMAATVHLGIALAVRVFGRAFTTPRFGFALLHPISSVIMTAILAASTWDGAVKKRVLWRGRTVELKDDVPRFVK